MKKRLGNRGIALLFLAALSIGVGVAYLPSQVRDLPTLPGALQFFVDQAPWSPFLTIYIYAIFWMATGAALVVASFMWRDMWAIGILIGLFFLVGFAFAVSFGFDVYAGHKSRDYVGAFVYAGFGGFLFFITRKEPGSS